MPDPPRRLPPSVEQRQDNINCSRGAHSQAGSVRAARPVTAGGAIGQRYIPPAMSGPIGWAEFDGGVITPGDTPVFTSPADSFGDISWVYTDSGIAIITVDGLYEFQFFSLGSGFGSEGGLGYVEVSGLRGVGVVAGSIFNTSASFGPLRLTAPFYVDCSTGGVADLSDSVITTGLFITRWA